MALVRSILFVDGENLTFRYQSLIASGRIPKQSVQHHQDVYVWTPEMGHRAVIDTDMIRINYYTSMVGGEDEVAKVREEISTLSYFMHGDFYGPCQLYPRVYKKAKQSTKSRLVDINITIDVMRHAYSNAIDVVYLFSGDGDFVNLAEEVARSGKKICIASFSSGLEPRLISSADRFVLLDDFYFEPMPQEPAVLQDPGRPS